MNAKGKSEASQTFTFKAKTQKLLDILIHSLYKEPEVFLRELLSNAADAITRLNFEVLTNREVHDPDVELGIWIITNPEKNTLTIRDTGIGMTKEELIQELGTIAHSGVEGFLEANKDPNSNLSNLIGQFGVGFYSAFMVADAVQVTSRSYQINEPAHTWSSRGSESFTIEPSDKLERGTVVIITLNKDSSEFSHEYRLQEIIKKHSDYIPYPIYLEDNKEQVNQQTAIWRRQPRDIKEDQYHDFYKQLTLNVDKPLDHIHMAIDAPVQMYAILYIPKSPERHIFSRRKQDGLKLYARKILIQEYTQDLLPTFFRFIQGVVDSEDIPLNISRESIQSNRIILQLKKIITSKVIDTLKQLAEEKPDEYIAFWEIYAGFIKEGIAVDLDYYESLLPFLRFRSLSTPNEWISLASYAENMKEGQDKIYYILGGEKDSVVHSPHLEIFKQRDYDVLLLVDPMDSFMLLRLNRYQEIDLANASLEDISPVENGKTEKMEIAEDELQKILGWFKEQLGERVSEVRTTERLTESPARLINKEGAVTPEMQRVYHYLNRDFRPRKKSLK